MNTPEQSELGKASAYADQYDASLLFPIARAGKRQEIGVGAQPPFFGADMWTAYELSWLNLRGKPQVALAQVVVPCETPNIVESKSFKLYLNSFNNSRFADTADVLARLRTDYVDLYQCHRYDPDTPLEETMQALTEIVQAGKVRYIGASNYTGWQLMKALWVADKKATERFVSQQIYYSLANEAAADVLAVLQTHFCHSQEDEVS